MKHYGKLGDKIEFKYILKKLKSPKKYFNLEEMSESFIDEHMGGTFHSENILKKEIVEFQGEGIICGVRNFLFSKIVDYCLDCDDISRNFIYTMDSEIVRKKCYAVAINLKQIVYVIIEE